MASGEAEPLQYTTTVLRVSIHCEGCKKKVKKVLHSIEGVYKVTIDATQHKVTVTGSVAADALVRRLLKSGKHAALWPMPAPAPPATEAKKPEEAPSAGKGGKGAEKVDAKPKKVAAEVEPESSEKPDKDEGSEKKPEKAGGKKPKDEAKDEAEVINEGS
uniref:HMA domain-containing protein n=1 Tax=Aegilops tauschii TaxID=37682 RepID=M8BQN5_AEGTA